MNLTGHRNVFLLNFLFNLREHRLYNTSGLVSHFNDVPAENNK